MVVVWNTLKVREGGDVTILAKAHTDVDINTMKVTFFDDTRYPSCSVFVINLIFIDVLPKVRMHV